MNVSDQRWCIWAGLISIAGLGAGLVIAGFLPPPAPNENVAEVARLYADDYERIRAAMLLMLFAVPLMLPFVVVIGLQMCRMEGRWTPLALVQVVAGGLGILAILLPTLLFLVAAFRPDDRAPEDTAQLHDMAWLTLIGTATFAMLQSSAIGVAILRHRSDNQVFPRWAGYFNLWAVLLFAPGYTVFCFDDGPLAWDGVIAFWIPAVTFFGWFLVMLVLLRRAVEEQGHARSVQVRSSTPNARGASSPHQGDESRQPSADINRS